MDKINFYNQSKPSFGKMFSLTRLADKTLNARIDKMPSASRRKTLKKFDKLVRKIVNSDYDVFVTGDKKCLVAYTCKHGCSETLSREKSNNSILFRFGLKNPIKFIETAYNRIAHANVKADTSNAVNTVLSKKL